ncbi:site-specific DNA-methyltransferase [Candidatus Poribacteria bacterium]|nr:site-specific DNA-methyltransferase [Candidatus Poribacteria bacterium]
MTFELLTASFGNLQASSKNEIQPETAELRDKIAALDAELTEDFKTQFSIAPFLSRKIVSFQGNKGKPAYSWYKYKEAFSAEFVEYFLGNYASRMSGRVLDPFAGIGTTLFAASAQGIPADGIELLPVGQEIMRARLLSERELTSNDIATLEHWMKSLPWRGFSEKVPFSTIRITENAYPPETVEAIEQYRGALQQENGKIQAILRLALLCILESVSYTRKDGQYLRWDARSGKQRPGTKAFNKGEILNFDAAITVKLKEILSDIRDVQMPVTFSPVKPTMADIRLFEGSCLEVLPSFETATYGAVMTSPPYCNRYDYTRTYALELTMLELTQAEVFHLRQQMLSCTVENREKDLLTIRPQWEPFIEVANQQKLLAAINVYLQHEKDSGTLNNSGIPRMVRGYFSEMACVIGECARILKPNARLFMVNDNVRYAGVGISVDMILSDIARSLGFEIERILVVPAKKGNSSQQMGTYGRVPLRKCVYIWRKR